MCRNSARGPDVARIVDCDNGVMIMLEVGVMVVAVACVVAVLVAVMKNSCVGSLWMALFGWIMSLCEVTVTVRRKLLAACTFSWYCFFLSVMLLRWHSTSSVAAISECNIPEGWIFNLLWC